MDQKPIIILGGGGHARVVADALYASKAEVLGFVDKDPQKTRLNGLHRLGGEGYILDSCHPEEVLVANGIGSIGWPADRFQWFIRLRERGYRFALIIHPRAIVSPSAHLGMGTQVMAGAIVQPGVHLGDNTLINTGAIVDHDCNISAHVHIGPGATLSGHISVGEYSHIGTGASIIQGIKVGKKCMVGAGSVVIRNVEDEITVAGVPAVKKA